MKKALLFLVFIPAICFGQKKFEISESVGYSLEATKTIGGSGFNDRVGLTCHFSKLVSFGAFYDLNVWHPNTNAGGLDIDIHLKKMFVGFDASYINIDPTEVGATTKRIAYTINYDPTVCLGFHIGTYLRFSDRVSVKEQLGVNYMDMNQQSHYATTSAVSIVYFNALIGLCYLF